VRLIDLCDRDSGEDFERGGSGQGKGAVGALDPAAAVVERGDMDGVDSQRLNPNASADDIRDRVEGAYFVKANISGRDAVDFALGDGDALKDSQGVFFNERRELAGLDELADLRVSAAMDMLVCMMMVAVLVAVAVVVRMLVIFVAVLLRV